MSNFNVDNYLDSAISEPSTRRPALPAGLELIGTVGEPKGSETKFTDKKTGEERTSKVINIPVEIDLTMYPEVRQQQGGIDKVTLTDSVFLDLTEAGTIDNSPGKNSKIRKWREATDLNAPGVSFTFRMLQGRRVKIKVSHRVDARDGEIYDQIGSVTKA